MSPILLLILLSPEEGYGGLAECPIPRDDSSYSWDSFQPKYSFFERGHTWGSPECCSGVWRRVIIGSQCLPGTVEATGVACTGEEHKQVALVHSLLAKLSKTEGEIPPWNTNSTEMTLWIVIEWWLKGGHSQVHYITYTCIPSDTAYSDNDKLDIEDNIKLQELPVITMRGLSDVSKCSFSPFTCRSITLELQKQVKHFQRLWW